MRNRDTGATPESIQACVEQRLGPERMRELILKYGDTAVEMELEQTGYHHAGCEEIGTSDVSWMVDGFLRGLGEPSYFKEK